MSESSAPTKVSGRLPGGQGYHSRRGRVLGSHAFRMWILVVGPKAALERSEGGVAILRQLGCRVETLDLWDAIDDDAMQQKPPAAVLVEAQDEVDAGRA